MAMGWKPRPVIGDKRFSNHSYREPSKTNNTRHHTMNHATDPAGGCTTIDNSAVGCTTINNSVGDARQSTCRGMHDKQQFCRGMHDNQHCCKGCLRLVKRPAKPPLFPERRCGDKATVEDAIAILEVVHLVEHALQHATNDIRPMTTSSGIRKTATSCNCPASQKTILVTLRQTIDESAKKSIW